MSLTRKVAFNTLVQVVGRLAGTALSLVAISVLTRYLGPGQYGDYSIAVLYAAIATTLADFGIIAIAVREMAARPDKAYDIGGLALSLKTYIQTALFVVFVPLVAFLPYANDVKAAIVLTLIGGLFATYISSLNLYFQYNLKLYLSTIVEVAIKIVSTLLILWFVSQNASFLQIVAINPIGILVGLGVGIMLLLRQGYPLKWTHNKALAIQLLKDSWPLGVVTIVGYLHFKIDSVLLSFLTSSHDVGIYSVAYRVIEIIIVLPAFYTGTVFPILSQYHGLKDPRLKDALQRSFDFLCLLGIPAALGVIAIAPQVVNLIAGSEFLGAIVPLQILMFAVFFSFLNNLFSSLAVIFNLQKRIIWITTTVLILNIVLNLIFIQWLGYTGAAITTLITEAASCVLVFILIQKHLPARFKIGRVLRMLAAGIIMTGAVMWLGNKGFNLFVLIVVGGSLYVGLVLAMRGISSAELKQLARR